MSLDTYTNLKDEIIDHLDRSDISANVDSFIDLAEARHKREIRIREMETRSQTTIGPETTRYLSLPSRFIQMQSFVLLPETGKPVVLNEVNSDSMARLRSTESGVPRYYTIHEEIEFDRVAAVEFTAEMVYWRSFLPLSGENETNDLLTIAPDAYLYAALAASAPFLISDERIPMWEQRYGIARDGLLVSDRRSRYGGPLVSRVTGATP